MATLVLPWVAHAALSLAPQQSADRRWRAAWRVALLLALVTAFAPVIWPLALLLALVAVVAGLWFDRGTWRRSRTWLPVLLAPAVVPVLLLPWVVGGLLGSASWYVEAGLPAADLLDGLGTWGVLTGRPTGGVGSAPGWFSLGIAVAAVAALLPRTTRRDVLAAWTVITVGLIGAVWLDLAGSWAGVPVLLVHAAAVTAVTLVAPGMAGALTGSSFGWRQPLGLVVVVGALLAPAAGVVWWAAAGVAGPLERQAPQAVPTYMLDAAQRDAAQGVLVLRAETQGIGYHLLRGDGPTTGDDSVAPDGERQEALTSLVTDLATEPTTEQVEQLSRYGVEFIYVQPPAPAGLVSGLDVVSGLTPASAPRPGARGWQLAGDPSLASVPAEPATGRTALLLLQALAVLAAVVLAAPSRKVVR